MLTALPAGAFFPVIMGPSFTRLCEQAGVGDAWFGILAALPAAAALLQIPAAMWLARFGSRKQVLLVCGVIHRLMWLPIALVALYLPPSPSTHLLFFTLIAISHGLGQIAGLAWHSWMSDLIPPRRRGRFFGLRHRMFHAGMLVFSLLIAWLMDAGAGWDAEHGLRIVLLGLFAVATVMGALDILGFIRVEDTPRRPAYALNTGHLLATLRDRDFRVTLLFAMAITASTFVIGPFLQLHMLNVARLGDAQVVLMLQTAPILAVLFVSAGWGRAVDRYGRKASLVLAVLGGSVTSASWILVFGGHWWLGIFIAIFGQMFWFGVDLSLYNYVLRFGSSARSAAAGPAYLSVYSSGCAAAALAAGVAAGQFAQWFEPSATLASLRERMEPIPMSSYMVLLWISVLMRIAALIFLLPRLPEETDRGTRQTVHLMVGQLYAAFHAFFRTAATSITVRRRPPRA